MRPENDARTAQPSRWFGRSDFMQEVAIEFGLTGGESVVLQLVAEGNHDSEIAQRLNVPVRHVRYLLDSGFRRLGLRSRIDVVRFLVARSFCEPRLDNGIVAPPGSTLSRFLRIVCHPRVYDEEIGPCLEDMWFEYAEAISQRRPWRARVIVLHGYVAVVRTLGLGWVVRAVWTAIKIWTGAG